MAGDDQAQGHGARAWSPDDNAASETVTSETVSAGFLGPECETEWLECVGIAPASDDVEPARPKTWLPGHVQPEPGRALCLQATLEQAERDCELGPTELILCAASPPRNNRRKERNNSRTERWTQQGITLLFLVVGVVGSMPRWVTLLACGQLHSPSDISSFQSDWAECRAEGTVFPSPDRGLAWRVMSITDLGLNAVGMTSACMALAYVATEHTKGRVVRFTITIHMAVMLIVGVMAMGMVLHDHLVASSFEMTSKYHWLPETMAVFDIVLLCELYVFLACYQLLYHPQIPEVTTKGKILSVFQTAFSCAGVAAFVLSMASIQSALLGVLGQSNFMAVYAPVVASKIVLLLLRKVAQGDGLLRTPLFMLSFAMNVTASTAVRKHIVDIADDSLVMIVASSLVLCLLEVLARLTITVSYLMATDALIRKRKLHRCCLAELVEICDTLSRRKEIMYGMVLVDQFAEIFVIVALTTADLAHPVWSQFRQWGSAANYEERVPAVLCAGAIQLSFECLADWVCMQKSLDFISYDITKSFRSTVYTMRFGVFALGIMFVTSFGFWPKCMTCEFPAYCLLYMACLRDGNVAFNGTNLCRYYVEEDYSAWLIAKENLNASDLGCYRPDVTCGVAFSMLDGD